MASKESSVASQITQGDRPVPLLDVTQTLSPDTSFMSNQTSASSEFSPQILISPTHIQHVSRMSNADLMERMPALMAHIENIEGQTATTNTPSGHYGPRLSVINQHSNRMTPSVASSETTEDPITPSPNEKNVDEMTMDELKTELKRKRHELKMVHIENSGLRAEYQQMSQTMMLVMHNSLGVSTQSHLSSEASRSIGNINCDIKDEDIEEDNISQVTSPLVTLPSTVPNLHEARSWCHQTHHSQNSGLQSMTAMRTVKSVPKPMSARQPMTSEMEVGVNIRATINGVCSLKKLY